MTSILIGTLLTIHIITCILLVFIILMQRPRTEGLGTTFGGGVTDTLFGSGTGNVLTKITTWLALIFFTTTISLAYLNSHRESGKSLKSHLMETTAPVGAPGQPAAAAPVVPVTPPVENATPVDGKTTSAPAVTPDSGKKPAK